MNKNIWIIANWKSNKSIAEALAWVEAVGPKLRQDSRVKVVVCPTDLAVEQVKKAILVGNFPILVGAQDVSAFDTGAYTGEEAARLLKEVVDLAIIGHSERRNLGETDELVAEKVMRSRESSIIPLVCVQDESTPVPEGVSLVAYEPVFAIGTGNPDTPANAATVATKLQEKYGEKTEILYGGSVTSENAKAFLQEEVIAGLLIGKASLDPEEFLKIIEIAGQV